MTSVTPGDSHSCAVADGRAYCWGGRTTAQSGNRTNSGSFVPKAVDTTGVLAGKTVTSITAGSYHSCAVADGKAYCWGEGNFGRLGNNSRSVSLVPVAVDSAKGDRQTQLPAAVTGLRARALRGKAKVTWKRAKGASSYKVRISKRRGRDFLSWKSVGSTTFTTKTAKGKKSTGCSERRTPRVGDLFGQSLSKAARWSEGAGADPVPDLRASKLVSAVMAQGRWPPADSAAPSLPLPLSLMRPGCNVGLPMGPTGRTRCCGEHWAERRLRTRHRGHPSPPP